MDDAGGDPQQNLRRLNLNLFHALAAILRAATLTEAGQMISLSQPAMSMALRRLREHFDDPIILYGRGERRLTALGEALRPRVMRIMREAGDVLDLRLEFEPATARRTILVAAPQEIELMFLRTVVPHLLQEGPGLQIHLVPFNYGSVEALFDRGVDVAILPGRMVDPALPMQPLFESTLTAIVCRDHPHFGETMTATEYLGGRHAALSKDMERANLSEQDHPLLARRNIVVRTSMYAMLPALVERTDLIATVSSWLGQYYAAMTPVRLVDVSAATFPTASVVAQWPAHLERSPHIEWVLEKLRNAISWGG